MSKILISGYYGFSNAGDEAMLTAIIEALRAERKDVEITVMSGKPEITAEKRSPHRAWREELRLSALIQFQYRSSE